MRFHQRLVVSSLLLGSAIGQQPVYSVSPGGSQPVPTQGVMEGGFVVAGNQVYFLGDTHDGAGLELRVCDGDPMSTRLVYEDAIGPGGGPPVVAVVGSKLLLGGPNSYWFSDGTSPRVPVTPPIPVIQTILGNVQGRLVYLADRGPTRVWSLDETGHTEPLATNDGTTLLAVGATHYLLSPGEIRTTDGTAAGTHLVHTFPGNAPIHANGRFYYLSVMTTFPELDLFEFDPVTNRTSPDLLPSVSSWPGNLGGTPTGVVLTLLDATGAQRLWASDRSPGAARRLNVPFDNVLTMAPWRDRTILCAHDPVHDIQAWITDGTEAGTYMLANLAPDRVIPGLVASTPQGTFLGVQHGAEHRVVFVDATGPRVLAEHRGLLDQFTLLGSRLLYGERVGQPYGATYRPMVTDLAATVASDLIPSILRPPHAVLRPGLDIALDPVAVGGNLVFSSGTTRRTTGTRASTQRIAAGSALARYAPYREAKTLVAVDDAAYVPVEELGGNIRWQRWDSATGVMEFTRLVSRGFPGLPVVTQRGDRFAWMGTELVLTDGVRAIQRFPGPAPLFAPTPTSLALNDDFAFATIPELYILDLGTGVWSQTAYTGTVVGTIGNRALLFDSGRYEYVATDGVSTEPLGIWSYRSPPERPFTWNGQSWLLGYALYTTDGTAAGTHQQPTPSGVELGQPAPLADAIYFAGYDSAHGTELWRFDGTSFTRVTDLVPGPRSGVFSVATCGDRLFLAASDGTDGIEPYLSDGTAAGTQRIADLMPGLASSMPTFLRIAGDHAYFLAQTPGFGNLMAIPLGQLGVAHSERLGQGCAGTNGIPQLSTPTLPRLGDAGFRFALRDGAPFAAAFFAVDTTTTLQQVGPCRLRCAGGLGVVSRTTNGAGSASWNLALPNAAPLLGLHLTAQAVVLDALAGPGFAASTTLGCVVGAM